MRRLLLSLFVLVLFVFAYPSQAQIPKPKKNTYVNDLAGVLSQADETELNKEIFQIERKRGVQLAIVLVKKIPAAYDIEEFAVLIGKRWGVGKGQKGIVYVAAINQRKQRIEVARKLDELFPYNVSLEILDRVKPGFRVKDYKEGLLQLIAGIDDVLPYTEGEQKRQQAQADSVQAVVKQKAIAKEIEDAKDDAESSRAFWKGFAFFLIAILVIYLILKLIRRGSSSSDEPAGGPGYYVGNDSSNYGSSSYSSSRRYTSYGSSGYRSGGSRIGDFATGAAAGYAARTLQERNDEERLARDRRDEEERRERDRREDEEREREEREREEEERRAEQEARDREDNAPRNWGNWSGGSSDSGSNDSGSSGFSTGSSSGATSDW